MHPPRHLRHLGIRGVFIMQISYGLLVHSILHRMVHLQYQPSSFRILLHGRLIEDGAYILQFLPPLIVCAKSQTPKRRVRPLVNNAGPTYPAGPFWGIGLAVCLRLLATPRSF